MKSKTNWSSHVTGWTACLRGNTNCAVCMSVLMSLLRSWQSCWTRRSWVECPCSSSPTSKTCWRPLLHQRSPRASTCTPSATACGRSSHALPSLEKVYRCVCVCVSHNNIQLNRYTFNSFSTNHTYSCMHAWLHTTKRKFLPEALICSFSISRVIVLVLRWLVFSLEEMWTVTTKWLEYDWGSFHLFALFIQGHNNSDCTLSSLPVFQDGMNWVCKSVNAKKK